MLPGFVIAVSKGGVGWGGWGGGCGYDVDGNGFIWDTDCKIHDTHLHHKAKTCKNS